MTQLVVRLARARMRRRTSPARRSASGQALVEFMFSAIVMFFFLFLMVSLAMLIVLSEYVEYSTFMAARAFKAGYSRQEGQLTHARDVFNRYIGNVVGTQLITPVGQLEISPGPDAPDNEKGMIFRYQVPLFYLPPFFIPGTVEPRVTLTAEAHLGREPSFQDACDVSSANSFFLRFLQATGVPLRSASPEQVAEQMEDNGC